MYSNTPSSRLFQAGSESQAQPTAAGALDRSRTLFGPPLLLDGESAAAYDELYARIWAGVKPADFLEEMFTADIVALHWDLLRWRRLQFSLLRKSGLKQLEKFLRENLPYLLFHDYFVEDLTKIIKDDFSKGREDAAQTLAQQCARNEERAVYKVNSILDRTIFDRAGVRAHHAHAPAKVPIIAGAGVHMTNLLDGARDRRLNELVKDYARREPGTVELIDKLLGSAGKSIDALMAEGLEGSLKYIEPIDRLATIAEGRRNAMLREIDRRRPILSETMRNTVQQIEHEELEVVKTRSAE